MIPRIFFILIFLLAAQIVYSKWVEHDVAQPDGVLVRETPEQKPTMAKPFRFGDAQITPLASFAIRARVLSREDYWFDNGDLMPVDLALGWGAMSDNTVLKNLIIAQGDRYYYWEVRDFYPIPRHEIETLSANVHLIPANGAIASAIKKVRRGNIVRFSGELVRVERDNGWMRRSSLTRDDTGNGACEIVWVKEFSIE